MYLIDHDSNNDILQIYVIYEEKGSNWRSLWISKKNKDLNIELLLLSFWYFTESETHSPILQRQFLFTSNKSSL